MNIRERGEAGDAPDARPEQGVVTLMETLDWRQTSVGAREEWPECLKSTLNLILPSQAQIVLFWGPDYAAFYNDAYAPTIGRKHPKALGQPARENWAELWDDLKPLLDRVLLNGETVAAKDRPFYIERHGHPEHVYFDISYSPVRDEAGVTRGVLCLVTETTERVRLEQNLKRSQEQLDCALDTAGMVGLFDWNLEEDNVRADTRFATFFGLDPARVLDGLPLDAFLDAIHPGDRERVWFAIDQARTTGRKITEEYRVLRADGSQRWIETHGRCLFSKDGEPLRLTGAVFDITQRKLAEDHVRQLAAIIASSDDAIISTDLDLVIRSWNEGAQHLYGYTAREIVGKSVDVLIPEDRKREADRIIEKIVRGERVETHETRRRRKDGTVIDVSLTVSPVFDDRGQITGASKIARDITAQKEAQRLTQVLMGELKHRVKNVLATVQAIARQTFGRTANGSGDIDTFVERLAALGRAHDLLTLGNWQDTDFRSLVTETLSPYADERFTIAGPDLRLSPRCAVAMSLSLHELATNAAKYGALSVPGGHVSIAWNLPAADRFELVWQESSGPPVAPPQHKGFGSKLITTLLAAELGGEVRLDYPPQGITCHVTAPLHNGQI